MTRSIPRGFASLTPTGQLRRLRAIAEEAMRAHDERSFRIRLLAESFNIVFRVDVADGGRRALRISPEHRIHPEGTEELEAEWMSEIREETSVVVPSLYRNRRGEVVTEISVPGVDGTRTCVLFGWVRGATLHANADVDRMRRAGALLAELHEHAAGRRDRTPPRGAMIADRVLHFETEDRLAECHARYGSILDEARDAAQSAIDALWETPPQAPHLLHGDFTWHNVLVGRDGLTVIDFQDVMYGFPVVDAVHALYPLEWSKGSQPLGDALRAGYAEVRPWPVEDRNLFGALVAARRVMQVNLGLNVRKPGVDEHIERHVRKLRRWLDEGPDPDIRSRLTW